MSQAQARSWWADVEHLREAAERRQADDAARRSADRRPSADPPADRATLRARGHAATRVREASGGAVDELTARRALALEERSPRARRPVPIWLAEDALVDPVAQARARAAAPRRTIEIRGRVAVADVALPDPRPAAAPVRRTRPHPGFAASFAARPDRIAFWAFALGIVLALVAATSSHAAVI